MNNQTSAVIVVFGASGDLAARKLLPALFELSCGRNLSPQYAVVGVARREFSTSEFRDRAREAIDEFIKTSDAPGVSTAAAEEFVQKLHYFALDLENIAGYSALRDTLSRIAAESNIVQNYLYFLSIPPHLYSVAAEGIAAAGLAKPSTRAWRRLLVEKPFGEDLASAIELNGKLLRHFDEEQIYRVDHYLGKETVQNILVTRLANGIFEPLWNCKHVHHIEITCSETAGIEGRAGYYDRIGALRDMVQNHMLHLLGFSALESPQSLDGEGIRREVLRTLDGLRPFTELDVPSRVVRGQYTRGSIDSMPLNGYLDEHGVSADSQTETFVAAKLFIDNERWRGVPIYLRTGKRLAAKVTEVVVHFRPGCNSVVGKRTAYSQIGSRVVCDSCNQLVLRIEPDEGLLLRFGTKVPGAGFRAQSVDMAFRYSSLSEFRLSSAYSRLLLDCLLGDTMLFPHGDTVIRCWEIVEPILRYWEKHSSEPLIKYEAGGWGPTEAEKLVENIDMMWRYPKQTLEGRIQ